MKLITKQRFEALAGYVRRPETELFAHELAWFSDDQERVLGILIGDIHDDDFGGIVLGRDVRGRFRAVHVSNEFRQLPELAQDDLRDAIRDWSGRPDSDFHQGDEKGTPMDVFTPVVPPNRFNPAFTRVALQEDFSPARQLIESMMPYYEDVDGNFVEQFQTTAFDARFWELYLFALFTEQGYVFNRDFTAPDFFCERIGESLFVEAVTVNPTRNGAGIIVEPEVPHTQQEFREYYEEYMPMKWGSPLTSKLKKKYWELNHVKDRPIIFAIQDFHVPRAMLGLSNSIQSYLYGISFSAVYDADGSLIVKSTPRGPHVWKGKTIESGFFNLPDAEHISAVITNPCATISKFNRMAYIASFGSEDVRMIVAGTQYDHDPNAAIPLSFTFSVTRGDYEESWIQGVNVYHNPNALHPFDETVLPKAAHHRFENGIYCSLIPDFHPFQTETTIITPDRCGSDEPLSLR